VSDIGTEVTGGSPGGSRGDGLFVLGMHRSGTSATAGALLRLGFDLGEQLIEAAPDNPKGYFEHAAAVAANEALLDALDRSWDDVRALPGDWMRAEAARAALPAIDAVLAGFSGKTAWALKDPRLCRTLPLWLDAAAARGIETRCLLVLRHPAEVAASLQARDDMSTEIAAILWLRHVLESLRGAAARPRTLLTYDALMRDPQAALGAACARLGFDIDAGIAADVRAFVDARDRHHRVDASVSADESSPSPFMRLAAEIYRAAVDASDPVVAMAAFETEFERCVAADAGWIDALGRTLRASDARRRGLLARALEAQSRAERLQTLFDDVSAQSLQRLDALQAHDERLAETQAALDAAEALSLERLVSLEEQDRRLGRTQAALEATEAQSLQRLVHARARRAQLDATESALAVAERLSLERQSELQALHARLAQTEAALASVEAVSLERLDAMQRLHAQLERVQVAFGEVERLSIERLADIEALHAALATRDDEIAGLRVQASELQALQRTRLFRARSALRRWFGLDRPQRT
jgi:hypothetical protein